MKRQQNNIWTSTQIIELINLNGQTCQATGRGQTYKDNKNINT